MILQNLEPYYRDERTAIYCCDCMELMKMLPDNCIDLVVTSPPYNIGTGKGANWKAKEWYSDDMPESEYQKWQRSIVLECLRVSEVVCYNHKVRNRDLRVIHPVFWLPHEYLYQEIIWSRERTPQMNKCYFHPTDERIYILATNPKGIMKDNGNFSTVWEIRFNQRTDFPNPNTFPDELVERCTRAFTEENGIVFDPFLGSGTTCVVARKMGRRSIGCDIVEEYCEVAKRRILGVRTD